MTGLTFSWDACQGAEATRRIGTRLFSPLNSVLMCILATVLGDGQRRSTSMRF